MGHQPGAVRKNDKLSTSYREKGNLLYASADHKNLFLDILELYNKSIAYAPSGSELLGLGYSNRSALLLESRKFNDSLIDIERSLNLSKSLTLKAKLLCRKAKCLKLLGDENAKEAIQAANNAVKLLNDKNLKLKEKLLKDLIEIIKLKKDIQPRKHDMIAPKFIPSEEYSDASHAVTLKTDDKNIRSLIAKKNIGTSEVIIEEKPYVAFPSLQNTYICCSHCLAFSLTNIPCESCCYAMYCSDSCKKQAWEEYHDWECLTIDSFFSEKYRILAEAYPRVSTDSGISIRLAIKCIKDHGFLLFIKDYLEYQDSCESGVESNELDTLSENTELPFHRIFQLNRKTETNSCVTCLSHDYVEFIFDMIQRHTDVAAIISKYAFIDKNLKKFVMYLLAETAAICAGSCYVAEFGFCKCYVSDYAVSHESHCRVDFGSILPWVSSLLSHSCAPNTYRLFSDGKVIILSSRPIKKDEECTITFGCIFTKMKKPLRKHYLMSGFALECHCIACKRDWAVPSLSDYHKTAVKARQNRHLAPLFSKYEDLIEMGRSAQTIRGLYYCTKDMIDLHYKHLNILEAAYGTAMFKQDMIEFFYQLFVKYYEIIHPEKCKFLNVEWQPFNIE